MPSSSEAITAAPGRPVATSSAMFGPESTATERPSTRVERRVPVAGSSPFVRISTGAVPDPHDVALAKTLLRLTPQERLRALRRYARLRQVAEEQL